MNNISEIKDNKQKVYSSEEILAPEQVRKILNSDNRELQQLCKHGRIFPKKDKTTGRVFFLKDDIESLKKVKEAYNSGLRAKAEGVILSDRNAVYREQPRGGSKTMNQQELEKPVLSPSQNNNQMEGRVCLENRVKNAIAVQKPVTGNFALNPSTAELDAIVDVVVAAKENVIERISKIVDDKLDGLDEIVVELINSKTESERLKDKINQLTKENYKLQEEMDKFKLVGLGLYLKK